MAKHSKIRLVLFLPDQQPLREARESVLQRYPGLAVVHLSSLEGQDQEARDVALESKLRSAKDTGYVIVDPPHEPGALEAIDRVARKALGRRGAPHAVFFAPPRAGKKNEEDPYAGYRDEFRSLFQYYRKDRRSVVFEKPRPGALRKAVKVAGKSRSPLRWTILAPMALTAVALLLVLFVFRDHLLQRATIHLGQVVFGARVDIDLYQTDLDPTLELRDLAIADRQAPMRNLVAFDRFRSDINFGALFGGRVHVREARLEGLEFGGAREVSGALPGLEIEHDGAPVDGAPPPLTEDSRSRFDALIEALVEKLEPPAPEDLETVRLARELEREAGERLERIRQRVEAGQLRQRIEAAHARVEGLVSPAVPESAQAFRDRIAGLGGLTLGNPLASAEGYLSEVTAVTFGAERKLVAQARARWDKIQDALGKAEKAIEDASKLTKLDFSNLAKLPKLIEDVSDAQKALSKSTKDLAGARELANQALQALTAKREAAGGALAEARKAATAARDAGAPAQLLEQWQGLRGDLDQVREDVLGARSEVEDTITEVAALVDEARAEWLALQAEITDAATFLEEGARELEAASRRDVESLKERYSFSSWKAEDLLAPLLGEELFGWYELGWSVRGRLAPFLGGKDVSEGTTKVELPGGGKRYLFPVDPDAKQDPGLWIESAAFSGRFSLGKGEALDLEGEALDVSSSPALTGKPILVEFEAREGSRRVQGTLGYDLDGVLQVDVTGAGFTSGILGTDHPYAPRLEREARVDWELRATFDGSGLRGTLKVHMTELALGFEGHGVEPALVQPFRDLYSAIDAVEAQVILAADASGLSELTVTSNLGEEVQQAFETALMAQVEAALTQAQAEIESEIAGPRDAALAAVEAFGVDSEALQSAFGVDLEDLSTLLDVRRSDLMQGMEESLTVPELPEEPPTSGPSDEEIAELEARIADQEARIEKKSGDQEGDAGEVLTAVTDTEAARDAARERLEAELARLEELRP